LRAGGRLNRAAPLGTAAAEFALAPAEGLQHLPPDVCQAKEKDHDDREVLDEGSHIFSIESWDTCTRARGPMIGDIGSPSPTTRCDANINPVPDEKLATGSRKTSTNRLLSIFGSPNAFAHAKQCGSIQKSPFNTFVQFQLRPLLGSRLVDFVISETHG
jgi:hypothetical protein